MFEVSGTLKKLKIRVFTFFCAISEIKKETQFFTRCCDQWKNKHTCEQDLFV